MKNVIVIHGCPSDPERAMDPEKRSYDKHWMPWLKDRLSEAGVPAQFPLMPEPWAPDYEKYKKVFDSLNVDEESILIGHSCGCAFLVRWLGDTKRVVRKLILVAPWKIPDEGDQVKRAFYHYPIDASIRSRVKEIALFTAPDEEEEGKESARIFQEALGGKLISLPDHGHYTRDDMGTDEFPELLQEI